MKPLPDHAYARRALSAVCALALLLWAAGCRRGADIRLGGEVMAPSKETAATVRKRLTDARDQLRVLGARVEGRVAWQENLEQFSGTAAATRPLRSETAVAHLSSGIFQATRRPGEQRQTRLVATFPRYRAVLEMLAIDDAFWLRKFQQNRLFLAGRLASDKARPPAWTSMRPQDLGILLLNDDLFPEREAQSSAVYLETWPQFYILHILRVDRKPEPIYSRVWVQRSDFTVRCHQLFDPDGTLVAEARMDEYKDFPLDAPKSWRSGEARPATGTARLPELVLLYWPRDRIVMQLRLKYETLNGPIDAAFFAPPDAARGAQLLPIPDED